MKTTRIVALGTGLGALLALGACATPPAQSSAPFERHATPVSEDPVVDGERVEGLEGAYYRAGRIVIGPQPTKADIRELRSRGVGTVVNLRSTDEVEALGFNEGVYVGRLGMNYAGIPLGGDNGYDPARVDMFARLMEGDRGEVFVHCASGARARAMVSAWLIRHRGWSEAQAKAWRRTMGEKPDALEQLLGDSAG